MDDRFQLLNIFPDEVWEIIYNKLEADSPADKEALFKASPFFRARLNQSKPVITLFPQVFLLLCPSLRESVLLKLRLVCQTWKNEVGRFLQNHSSHLKPGENCERVFAKVFKWSQIQLSPLLYPTLPSFMTHFQQTHARSEDSPFVARSLELRKEFGINVSRYEILNVEPFWKQIFRLLEKYGHHLWYCDIFVPDLFPDLSKYYQALRKCVVLMPNLKALNICYTRPSVYVSAHTCQSISNLDAEVKNYPFPKMAHLKLLKLFGLPTSIFNEIVEKNSHVEVIDVNSGTPQNYNTDYLLFSVDLPNVTNLILNYSNSTDVFKICTSQISGRVQKLCIENNKNAAPEKSYLEFTQILSVISDRWTDTLTHLCLCLPAPPTNELNQKAYEKFANFTLDLPKLCRLKVSLWNWLPLDFLLPTKDTLEYLYVVVNRTLTDKEESLKYLRAFKKDKQILVGYCQWQNMKKSNVWEIFTKLDQFFVEDSRIQSGDSASQAQPYIWKCSRREYLKLKSYDRQ